MEACEASLHPKEKREKAATWPTDMGFILPLFPGDVRDSDGRQLGGSESPIHPHTATLPRSAAVDQYGDVSSVVESACEAPR